MRILVTLMVLALVVLFSIDTAVAEGVSIGGVHVDGKNYGGIYLPNGSYGSIHQRTEINDLRSGMQIVTTRENDRYEDEDDNVCICDAEPIDIPVVVAPRGRGFASIKAKELMQNAE